MASRVKLFVNATSLGGVESLIEHRASSEGKTSNAPQNLFVCLWGWSIPTTSSKTLCRRLAEEGFLSAHDA